jgi:hypothetical protein
MFDQKTKPLSPEPLPPGFIGLLFDTEESRGSARAGYMLIPASGRTR